MKLARPTAEANGVRLDVQLQPMVVLGDEHRLAQVAENLIGNAVKYSPGGDVLVSVRPDGDSALLEIADTGVGIPDDELPRLFDRYYRASTSVGFDGTGIGLSVVKAIVDSHDGTIEVESAAGRGTTIRLLLPAR